MGFDGETVADQNSVERESENGEELSMNTGLSTSSRVGTKKNEIINLVERL